MSDVESAFGAKIFELRKERGWSQQQLAKKIGTSGAIVGRYERGDMLPSIKVGHKIAEALGVTLDSLVADRDLPDILHDQGMVQRWQAIEDLPTDDREKILYLVDGLIRDAKARQAYGRTA